MRSLVISLALLVTACLSTSSDPRLARIEQITTLCNGYGETLGVLTSMKVAGKLSDGQIAKIDAAEIVATRVCLQADPNNLTDVAIDAGINAIIVLTMMGDDDG